MGGNLVKRLPILNIDQIKKADNEKTLAGFIGALAGIGTNINQSQTGEVKLEKRKVNVLIKEMDSDDRVFDDSIPLYDRMHIHLRRRMLFVDSLCPPLTASIGGHMADLHQANPDDIPNGHDCQFYFFKGSAEVMNINCNIISPAGLSKSYMMSKYFEARTGICPLRSKYRGVITEAGFVGREEPGTGEARPGDAYEYRNGFLLFNEISNIMIAAQTTHSAALINQVMEALSERQVTKRTGGLDLCYPTNITMWGGIQPRRFDFSQGLGRRFIHVTKAWTGDDLKMFKDERLKEKLSPESSRKVNMREVEKIRKDIADLLHNAQVEKVEWDSNMYHFLMKYSIGHIDLQMMERVLIGKEYLNQGLGQVIKIKNSDDNKALIIMIHDMSKIVAEGGDLSLLLSSIGKESKSRDVLWTDFRRFGYTYVMFMELIEMAMKLNLVSKKYDATYGGYVYKRSGKDRPGGVEKRDDDKQAIIDRLKNRGKVEPIDSLV